ncbi:LysE family transporter [Janthinobacterium agaricidamnosum]|uniref:Putative membrane protein n=1 Tax=Janthinobacterium agaricidamnosum NBRC 102515 = DSM 9628 TaxID=1349767 RepID=W0V4I8_9BURK|nr:LysE family transporter [Janthinobacterium agaricidamnosum]CDG82796.1 putative membrane protein [Janthinobacterium agaricidamnosum NBRC 102515 = DSM 9628]
MNDISHLAVLIAAASLIILLPGPPWQPIATQARHSRRRAWRAALAVAVGDISVIICSGLLFTLIALEWPLLLEVLKVAVGLYILYLGLCLLNSPACAADTPPQEAAPDDFALSLLTALRHPRPMLFFAAFFPLALDQEPVSQLFDFYILGGLFECLSLLYHAALILLAARLHALRLPLQKIGACCLILGSLAIMYT